MTTVDALIHPVAGRPSRLPLALRLALRELRAGLGGFYVFIACVALGVTVITGVGALSDALRSGFERQGRAILGGDATLARAHARSQGAERAWIQRRGSMSETATMRAMARTAAGDEQALIELKGVDPAYPLVGEVRLGEGRTLDAAVRSTAGAAVAPVLLERLGIKPGDPIRIGSLELPVTATIAQEPDTISDRLAYGARVIVSLETLERTGLVQPGSLIRWRYALLLPEGSRAEGLVRFRDAVKSELPEAGFTIADRRDPSPQVTRTLDRLRQFLTLIGLTALLVGGVGVANAVSTFIDRRRKVIATFKSVGATGGTVFAVFLAQVLLIAGIGVAIGLMLGYLVPVVLAATIGDALPIKAEITVGAWSLASAAAYGILVALVFTLWPLGQAGLVRANVLFRDEVAPDRRWPRPAIVLATIAAALMLAVFAIASSDSTRIAVYFCLGLVLVFSVFIGLGSAVTAVARRIPRPRQPELALALGNLAAPGGLTRAVVLSLGAGLSLLVAVALTDASIVNELSARLPKNSPTYFVLDVPKGEHERFAGVVRGTVEGTRVDDAPMLRGRLVALKGVPVEAVKAPPEAQWVLTGDRGLSYSEAVPDGSRVVAGAWWPKDYAGEPLVSFEHDLAGKLGLALGDTVTVNVLGRNMTARIASLREVKWESLAINFVMVFSPSALKAAPHNLLATITLPAGAGLGEEARVARVLARDFPAVTAIPVREAIRNFNLVFGKVMTAVRVAGGVTLLAGAIVLAGALATAQRRRIKQAVILKTLGATRRRIMAAHLVEYLILASVTALFAVLLGSLASWVALNRVIEVDFLFSPAAVLQALGLSIGLVALFGGIGTWSVLRAPAVPYLRSE
jgi:putative ABC transport system permease protein